MALDHLPVVGLRAVLGPVDHERINPLPHRGQLVLEIDGVLPVHPLDPLQRLAPLDDRPLEHRVGERHQIVHELVELVEKAALDHLVVHLALHVLGFTRRLLAQLVDHDLLARDEVLLHLVLRWVDPHRGGNGQLLTDALVGALHELRRQLRHRGRAQDIGDGPLARVVHHVPDPARRGARLVRGQHEVDRRAALLLDLGENIRVVLATALAQAGEQSRLDILLLVVPHRTPPGFDVPRKVGDVRAVVGDLRLRLLLGVELRKVLDGQHTPDGHDEPGARLRRQRSVEIHVHPWGMGARRCHRL